MSKIVRISISSSLLDNRYKQDVSGFTHAICYERDTARFASDTRYELKRECAVLRILFPKAKRKAIVVLQDKNSNALLLFLSAGKNCSLFLLFRLFQSFLHRVGNAFTAGGGSRHGVHIGTLLFQNFRNHLLLCIKEIILIILRFHDVDGGHLSA